MPATASAAAIRESLGGDPTLKRFMTPPLALSETTRFFFADAALPAAQYLKAAGDRWNLFLCLMNLRHQSASRPFPGMRKRMREMVCALTLAAHWLSTDCCVVIGRKSSDRLVM